MNLSETAFILPCDGTATGGAATGAPPGFELRWFTPKVEVALCGHATLASAHALWSEGRVPRGAEIGFHTKSGRLAAVASGPLIELDFPTQPAAECPPPPGLLDALGTIAQFVGRNTFDYLVEVQSEAAVRGLSPDFARLGRIEVRGVIVTSRASPPYDFVSRFFAPAAGVNEDPVTGSAHCCLGAFWQERLRKNEFTAFQASARGGVVQVRVAGERTYLGGQAVTVARGELLT